MSGEMRRPPQLWEQRLARTTSILGAGISSSGDATAIVPPSSPPGAGGGTEPAPVAPAPGLFIAPSAPTLIGSVQGINVVWNGLNSAGDLWPSDTSYVEVHMSTAGTGFTPDASTLKGRLVRPGGLAVTGLTSGVTYHFRLRGADPAGNYTTAGAAASGTPGLITAPDIAANAITANSIVAGTITGWSINAAFLSGGTVSGGFITGGTVSGALVTGGTVSGGTLQTSSGGSRITIKSDIIAGNIDAIEFRSGGNVAAALYGDATGLICNDQLTVFGDLDTSGTLTADSMRPTANAIVFQGYRETATAGDVIMRLSSDVTSANQAKFEVDADGDVKSRTNSYAGFSDARYKENVTPARDYLQDLRDVEVVTFNWEGSEQKLLGVTAQQIQPIFPNMVAEDEDGTLSVRYSVFVPMLITAVQSLATEVEDLRARIEALEA
jgi:hypothetical protein